MTLATGVRTHIVTDPNLRKTRLIAWTVAITAVLVVLDYLTGAQFVAFVGGLLGMA